LRPERQHEQPEHGTPEFGTTERAHRSRPVAEEPANPWYLVDTEPEGIQRRVSRGMLAALMLPVLVIALVIGLGSLGALVGTSFVRPVSRVVSTYVNAKLPPLPQEAETSFLYDADGRLLTTLHGSVNRVAVPLADISQNLQDAVISVEDKNFYREGGVSIEGTLRAALVDLTQHQAAQGGSTITQQYVKLMYTGSERTISRKLKEVVLAQQLSRVRTKAQILEGYLNAVYFGNAAYGAQAAAETYFHEPASKLDVVQAATLAGMVQAPALYNPYQNPSLVKVRRDEVIQDMAAQGYLDPSDAAKDEAAPLKVKQPATARQPAAYFVDAADRALQQQFGVQQTFAGGLQVTTTLDRTWQSYAEHAIAAHLTQPGDPSAALVAIDPSTGAVRALVGGTDFTRVKFNLATQAHRQAGSAFKPFTYATAMKQRIDPHAVMNGPPQLTVPDPECMTSNQPWVVHNFADETAGTMSLMQAIAHSVNTIFAQLVVDVGPEQVAATAHAMGIQSTLLPVCSITLGTQPVTPLEMTDAYATLASGGIHHAAQFLQQVKSPTGRVLEQLNGRGKRVLGANDAALVTDALQGVITGGTGTAAGIGRPAAGKTGTAENYVDAWFCGYTPQLTTCVWVGYPKGEISMHNVEGFPDVFGGSLPAEIWHDFMSKAMQGLPVESFPTPSFIGYDTQPQRIAPVAPPAPPSATPSPRCQLHPRKCH
jgi:penicillin-binding protein 1A